MRKFDNRMHAKDAYLALVAELAPAMGAAKSEFRLNEEEKNKWADSKLCPSVFIACSSRSSLKRYPAARLKEIVCVLKENFPLIVIGEENDRAYYQDILSEKGVVDFVGKTKLYEVFYLLKNYAKGLLCVDSSIMQLASYVNIPIVALFGPTDPARYGPWSDTFTVLHKDAMPCSPCKKPTCNFTAECMQIRPTDVLEAVNKILGKSSA
jgi:heptosyltransferase-2